MDERRVVKVVEPIIVMEGAGVKVRRTIGSMGLRHLNPFMLLDHFGSDDPEEYQAGFPMHMHRGIQTLTYMLYGAMEHRDSSGGHDQVGPGGAQLMMAGAGIRHAELPKAGEGGRMEGLQLWFGLPRNLQDASPHYYAASADAIPELATDDGVTMRVVAGELDGTQGPITHIAVAARYLDVHLRAGASFSQAMPDDQTVFAYVYEGEGAFGAKSGTPVGPRILAVFGDGSEVIAQAGEGGVRFILVSGAPIS